ncbi:hypothetical protein Dimus_033546 [Dionaea muscipula]
MGESKLLKAWRLEAMLERSVGEDDETLGGARNEVRLLLPSRISGVDSVEVGMRPDLVVSPEDWVSMVDIRPDLSSSSEVSASAMEDVDDRRPSLGSSTMSLKPIEEFRLPMGSSPDEFDESALIVGGLDDCGGLILRGAGPELAGAELPSKVPPVSPSSSLSTSSQFFVVIRRLAEGDDGSAMAADRMKPDVVYTGVDSDCGKGLGHEIFSNGPPELRSIAEGLSSFVGKVSTEHTGVVDDERGWGASLGSLTAGSGSVVTAGAQAEINSLSVFASPHGLPVSATAIVDDGLVREEVRVSSMAREALRPQPTDGLWRPPSSPMEPVSEWEKKVVPGGVSVAQVVHRGVQSSRTYAYVVHADRRADVELSFIPPVDGGNSITMEESDGDAEWWGSCLVGYFLQGSLPFGYVRSTVSRLWTKLGLIEVKSLDDGFFVFRFADSFSRDGLLEGGPCE